MSNYSQSGDEEEDISPLEYARLNGLAYNHISEPIPLPYHATSPPHISSNITDDSQLYQFKFPDCSTDERLTVSKDAAHLIAWVSKTERPEVIESAVLSMLGS